MSLSKETPNFGFLTGWQTTRLRDGGGISAPLDVRTIKLYELVFFVGMLTMGFFFIDHSPFASDYFKNMDAYTGAVNRTADRIERINLISAPVRILLGFTGIICLFATRGKTLRFSWVLITLGAYFGYLGLSVLWSVSPQISLQKFLVICMMATASLGIAKRLSLHDQAIVFTFVCTAYIAIGFAAEILLGNFTPHRSEYRFVGTCHPNTLAAYGTICCLAAPVFTRHGKAFNVTTWSFIALGIIVLLATKSRTTLAGMIFAATMTRMITFKANHRMLGFSLVMCAAVAIGMVFALSRASTWSTAGNVMAMGRTDDVTSLTGRLPLWEELTRNIKYYPLTGHGYLAFWKKENIEMLSEMFGWEIPHGHNMYLDVMLDGGIAGLFLFVTFHLTTLLTAFKRYLFSRDAAVAFVFGMIAFALVHGFGESLFKLPTFLSFVIVTLAIRIAVLQPLSARPVLAKTST